MTAKPCKKDPWVPVRDMIEGGTPIISAAEYEQAFWNAVKDDNWTAAETLMQAYVFVWPKEGSNFQVRIRVAIDMFKGET